MSDVAQGPGDARAGTGAKGSGHRQLGVLLECFSGAKTASSVEGRLKAQDDAVLDTVVLRVNAKHKASVHDPRRVVQGT